MFHKLGIQSDFIVISATVKHVCAEIRETKEHLGVCGTFTTGRKPTSRFDFGFDLGILESGFVDQIHVF